MSWPIACLLAAGALAFGCAGNGDDAAEPTRVPDTPPSTSSTVTTNRSDDLTTNTSVDTSDDTSTLGTTRPATTGQPVTTSGPDLEVPSGADDPRVAGAIDEISERFGYPREEIEVASIEPVTWPTTALGCPATGATYAEVEVPGYRITLTWEDLVFVYHGALDGTPPFRCEFLD